ncbi:MAG: GIY-YIG nuclease family protein [Clostridia bacterium]|nr:GIY-YIG nuclease family protein [Clostridia bacterium]
MYYVYVLRCSDSSLYCGYTTDVLHRLSAHLGKVPGGAKYTRSHRPVRYEIVWKTSCKESALKLEAQFKKIPKSEKEFLIAGSGNFETVFGDKLNADDYERAAEYERSLIESQE